MAIITKFTDFINEYLNTIDLQKEYDELNTLLFNGELKPVPLKWVKTKNSGGHVHSTKVNGIETINYLAISNFRNRSYEKFRDILAHEMIHVYILQKNIKEYGGYHGVRFQELMNEINKKGFNVTIKDDGEGEIETKSLNKPIGVILTKNKVTNTLSISTVSTDILEDAAKNIIERYEYSGKIRKQSYEFWVLRSNNPLIGIYKIARKVKTLTSYIFKGTENDFNDLISSSELIEHKVQSVEYVTEELSLSKNSKYLYHTPWIGYVDDILHSNCLLAQKSEENSNTRDHNAVSFSRDSKLFYDEQPIRLRLNRDKLEKDYTLEPYIDPLFNGIDHEQEEMCRTTIKNLDKYLDAIEITTDPRLTKFVEIWDIEEILPEIESYVNKYKTPIIKLEQNGKETPIQVDEIMDIFKKLLENKKQFKTKFQEFIKENSDNDLITLYHGSSEYNEKALLENGWEPHKSTSGNQQGNPAYLYLTTTPESACWYACMKGNDKNVLEVTLPKSYLRVDPEDALWSPLSSDIDKELNRGETNFVCIKPINKEAFKKYTGPFSVTGCDDCD